MADDKETQIEIAERLQLKMLKRWETLLEDGALSPQDAATLTRFLLANGWNVDPSKVPARLRDMLTKHIDPKELDEDDEFRVQ